MSRPQDPRDADGRVVVRLGDLLQRAHTEGLRRVRTRIVQVPVRENGYLAVAHAEVRLTRGTFTGVGDASPESVDPPFAVHAVRVAESRALARAFRFALGVADVCQEELCGTDAQSPPQHPPVRTVSARDSRVRSDGGAIPRPPPSGVRTFPASRAEQHERKPSDFAMSDAQRKKLFRLAFDLGASKDSARDLILQAADVGRLEWMTREVASKTIDVLANRVANRMGDGSGAATNGHGTNGASNGNGASHDDIPF